MPICGFHWHSRYSISFFGLLVLVYREFLWPFVVGSLILWLICFIYKFIRWFKFTLKPPYTVASGNLLLAIWDTSHWTSFVKFGLKTAWDISYDILWPILKYVNFWRLQGRLSNLSKKMPSENLFFLDEGMTGLWWGLGGKV